jgi:RNA polymerase sigma factor (sigma-70 family)
MEADLLRGFRRGERDALARVYRLHIDAVDDLVRAALLRAGAFSAANLADLVQDVFMKAFADAARDGYDGLRDYAPYLLTIARNVVIDWLRRAGREIPTSDLEAALGADASGTDGEQPFPPPVLALAAAYVRALPPELKAVHERRFVLAEPQLQASAALGLSRQRLRTLEAKLVEGLRRELRRAGVDVSPTKAGSPSVVPARKAGP